MLITIFSGTGLNILPASGMTETRVSPPFGSEAYWPYVAANPVTAFLDIAKHLILPVITLVVVNIAGDSRFVRASMLDTLSQDFVRTAKAKGLPGRVVTYKHAMRNAMLPVVTNIGLEIPFLFTGALVTETIFGWPGIGNMSIDATRSFDYPVLMGVLFITAIITVFANLARRRHLRRRRSAHQVLRADLHVGTVRPREQGTHPRRRRTRSTSGWPSRAPTSRSTSSR